MCKKIVMVCLLVNLTIKIFYELETVENAFLKMYLFFPTKFKKAICSFQLEYGDIYSLISHWMIWLRFRAYVTIFITYVQTIVSMLKKLINQREYLEKDPGFLVAINSYVKIFISLFRKLMTYVLIIIDNLIPARKIIHHTLYFSLLPLRVWIHLFQCCRPQHESNMCLFCTKLYSTNRKICNVIEKN